MLFNLIIARENGVESWGWSGVGDNVMTLGYLNEFLGRRFNIFVDVFCKLQLPITYFVTKYLDSLPCNNLEEYYLQKNIACNRFSY